MQTENELIVYEDVLQDDAADTFAEAYTEVPSGADVDAAQLFADATSVVANVILCAALLVAGVLCGIRFWR